MHVEGVRTVKSLLGVALLCAGLVVSPSATSIAATEWQVSSAGNDVSGCGTSIEPCKTVSFVLAQPGFSVGDQIFLAGEIIDGFTFAQDVTLTGVANAVINGNGARIVNVVNGVTATINNLTLKNGGGNQDGGLVNNQGTLIFNNVLLTQSVIVGASGGAIYNAGVLTLNDSEVSNNKAQYGGGIENQGLLFVSNSTIAGNQATVDGGGIDNFMSGTLHLNRVVVSGNVASGGGGGIYNETGILTSRVWLTDTAVVSNTAQNVSAGIFSRGNLTLLNVTLSSNHMAGGPGVALDHHDGTLDMRNVTIAGNTVTNRNGSSAVSFASTGASTLVNTVIANSAVDNCSGNATSNGYNLSSDGTCSFLSQPTDMVNADALLGPLQLSALAYDTFTNPPTQGSPLVNRIPTQSCGVNRDQRGISRPQDGACDIGAHEAVPVDLSIAAASSPSVLPAGTTLTVQLSMANAGPDVANGVVVTSDLPAGTSLLDCDVACLTSGSRLTATVGTLNAGANASAQVRLVPQNGGALSVPFYIASDAWDNQTSNNVAVANATVQEAADVSAVLKGPSTVAVNTTFIMTAEVENKSAFAVSAMNITITLPSAASYISSGGVNWTCAPIPSSILSCNYALPLGARSFATPVKITMKSGNSPATLQFSGSASSSLYDPNPTNNMFDTVTVVRTGTKTYLPITIR